MQRRVTQVKVRDTAAFQHRSCEYPSVTSVLACWLRAGIELNVSQAAYRQSLIHGPCILSDNWVCCPQPTLIAPNLSTLPIFVNPLTPLQLIELAFKTEPQNHVSR